MKKLIILLCLIFIPALTASDTSTYVLAVSGQDAGGGATYLINQNFEGTGFDNSESWTESTYHTDPDFSSVALRGSQSLLVGNPAGVGEGIVTSPTFSESGEVFGHFLYRPYLIVPSAQYFFDLLGGGTTIFRIYQNANGTMAIRVGSTFVSYTSTALSADTTYHIWFHFKTGTGANAEGRLWIGSTTSRPETAELTTTSGTATANVDNARFYNADPAENGVLVDQVLLSTSEFTSVDS